MNRHLRKADSPKETKRLKVCQIFGRNEGSFAPNYTEPCFDPWKYADQDYHVLELTRLLSHRKFVLFCACLFEIYNERCGGDLVDDEQGISVGMYQVGDYAEAAWQAELENGCDT